MLNFVLGLVWAKRMEKEKWNNGRCPICGKPWIRFDTDSQGGRMYKCENDHRCTITYNVDK
jgi:ssDNA-binding Zn-finger/Zn-ribbon topoisomerase 1